MKPVTEKNSLSLSWRLEKAVCLSLNGGYTNATLPAPPPMGSPFQEKYRREIEEGGKEE
jgi:hypothetical protein